MRYNIILFRFFSPNLAEEMDQADSELRDTITNIWPLQAKKMLNLLVPPNDQLNKGKLTVGKVYAGLLIYEAYRIRREGGQTQGSMGVSYHDKNLMNYYNNFNKNLSLKIYKYLFFNKFRYKINKLKQNEKLNIS